MDMKLNKKNVLKWNETLCYGLHFTLAFLLPALFYVLLKTHVSDQSDPMYFYYVVFIGHPILHVFAALSVLALISSIISRKQLLLFLCIFPAILCAEWFYQTFFSLDQVKLIHVIYTLIVIILFALCYKTKTKVTDKNSGVSNAI